MDFRSVDQAYPPPSELVPSTSVESLLASKGQEVWSVSPDSLVIDAVRTMTERRIGALLVMRAQKLVGIFSERDYLRRVVLEDRSSSTTPVGSIMTQTVVTAGLRQTVQECMQLMTDRRIRHLPIVEGERVIGLVSIGDVVKASLAYQHHLLGEIERYVQGVPGATLGHGGLRQSS